ncbi:MAG: hypothetical protein IVW56_07075 [Candidatus Binataceae bacterium]|nr:hypothetical protein [Candidatus Binataceae bacterium]
MNWGVPTIAGIQRTTALLTIIFATLLIAFAARAAALGCVVGGALMVANLFLLTIVGRTLVALAQGGAAGKAGVILAPLKLFFFVAAVYLIMTSVRLNLPGFMLGALTQFLAIFIETWHASSREAQVRPGDGTAPPPEGAVIPEDQSV